MNNLKLLIILFSCIKLFPFEYGAASIQGDRPYQEDRYSLAGDTISNYFGVFDGHVGSKVSQFLKQHLHENILTKVDFSDPNIIIENLEKSFLEINESLVNNGIENEGSTAIIAYIKNNKIFIANTGDSRAIIIKNDQTIQLSEDHKPNRPDEKSRIEKLGGRILYRGCWRILTKHGGLSLSRAIGDKSFFPYIIPNPEITVTNITDDCQFIVLASDGLWDKLSNEEVAKFVKERSKNTQDYNKIALDLVNEAYNKGSEDNITAIIISLSNFTEINKLETDLDKVVRNNSQSVENNNFEYIKKILNNKKITVSILVMMFLYRKQLNNYLKTLTMILKSVNFKTGLIMFLASGTYFLLNETKKDMDLDLISDNLVNFDVLKQENLDSGYHAIKNGCYVIKMLSGLMDEDLCKKYLLTNETSIFPLLYWKNKILNLRSAGINDSDLNAHEIKYIIENWSEFNNFSYTIISNITKEDCECTEDIMPITKSFKEHLQKIHLFLLSSKEYIHSNDKDQVIDNNGHWISVVVQKKGNKINYYVMDSLSVDSVLPLIKKLKKLIKF